MEYSVYRKTAANEWVLVDAEKPVVEEKVEKNANGSTKITLSTLGRAYYSEKIDVTKPIYFEMDIETAKRALRTGWRYPCSTTRRCFLLSAKRTARTGLLSFTDIIKVNFSPRAFFPTRFSSPNI